MLHLTGKAAKKPAVTGFVSSFIHFGFYASVKLPCLAFEFANFALDHNMDINAVCLARVITQAKDDQITAHFDTMAKGAVYNDYISRV